MTPESAPTIDAATALTDARIHELRQAATRQAGSMVDPRRMRRIESWWRSELCEWATAIVGEPVTGLRALSWQKWVLLDLAHETEPSPPPPPILTARRAQQRRADEQRAHADRAARQAQVAEWDALRAALPVPVSVAFNFSRHTYEFHTHGGSHIVAWSDVHTGRLHRRAGQALCETPSRARQLHLDNKRLERDAQDTGREQAVPDCRACLRLARRLAGGHGQA